MSSCSYILKRLLHFLHLYVYYHILCMRCFVIFVCKYVVLVVVFTILNLWKQTIKLSITCFFKIAVFFQSAQFEIFRNYFFSCYLEYKTWYSAEILNCQLCTGPLALAVIHFKKAFYWYFFYTLIDLQFLFKVHNTEKSCLTLPIGGKNVESELICWQFKLKFWISIICLTL